VLRSVIIELSWGRGAPHSFLGHVFQVTLKPTVPRHLPSRLFFEGGAYSGAGLSRSPVMRRSGPFGGPETPALRLRTNVLHRTRRILGQCQGFTRAWSSYAAFVPIRGWA
jgi:hypothetical protein